MKNKFIPKTSFRKTPSTQKQHYQNISRETEKLTAELQRCAEQLDWNKAVGIRTPDQKEKSATLELRLTQTEAAALKTKLKTIDLFQYGCTTTLTQETETQNDNTHIYALKLSTTLNGKRDEVMDALTNATRDIRVALKHTYKINPKP